jgi:hypothetical protein
MQSDFFWKDKVPSAVEIRRAAKKRYAELVESLVLARAMHAPHCSRPQPKRVPVRPRWLRSTSSRGVS